MVFQSLTDITVQILEATILTFARIWFIILISILLSLVFGTLAARVDSARAIIIPVVDVLEAVPVVAFFPIVLVFFLDDVGGGLGLELAVDILILTATLWNMILAAFEGVRNIPEECIQLQNVYRLGFFSRVRKVYFPSAYSRIVSNISPSFNSALFYITLSEVILIGNRSYGVFGIGSLSISFSSSGNIPGIELLILILVIFITMNYYFVIDPWIRSSQKYSFDSEAKAVGKTKSGVISSFAGSIRTRTNQVMISGERLVSAITRTGKPAERRERRRLSLSSKELNYFVGALLLLMLSLAIYSILEAGFYQAFVIYFFSPAFLWDSLIGLLYDLGRIGIVYVITVITMVPVAVILGTRKTLGRVFTSILQIIYSIPAPIFLPILLITFLPWMAGYFGESVAINSVVIIIAFLSAASYVFFNVYGAMQTIPSELDMVSKAYSIKGFKRFRKLTLPAIFPSLVTGSVASIGSYWGGLLVAEYVLFAGTKYEVHNGLMKSLDIAMATGGTGLLRADAIDIFLVLVIVAISFLVTLRLYNVANKKFSINT